MTPLLEVRDLRVSFPASGGGTIHPVDGVSFTLERGRTLALVGESGCGKSLTGLALLRLVPSPGRVDTSSAIRLAGTDLMSLDETAMRAVRGGRIGMVFQDPMTSLNPVLTAGDQIAEAIRAHRAVARRDARARAEALLGEVGIADPARRLDEYPHQLSGGMRQRVMIAIALAAEPEIIIADEPTTALDVTVQAQILELLDRLRQERGMAVLLITHDLGVVAGRADDMCVMYAGQIVERASTRQVFEAPAHPYTRGLFGSVPTITGPRERLTPIAGSVPPPNAWPGGCRFGPRCPERFARCDQMPSLRRGAPGHEARCWLTGDGA
jgi:oligopeptide/dipeptide ABC transporter ATP-binding protein